MTIVNGSYVYNYNTVNYTQLHGNTLGGKNKLIICNWEIYVSIYVMYNETY